MPQTDLGLRRAREAALSGGRPATGVRTVVEASWQRVRARGLAPGSEPSVAPLSESDLEQRRARSGLAPLVDRLRAALAPALDDGEQIMVVSDAEGRVLWREGRGGVRRLADRLGFVGGSAWTEGNVGTNAIGTSLVLGAPVLIHGPEHYVESHTRWSCAAAPVRDPWTGRALGVVDLSGPATPARSGHGLALVELAARVAELEVRAAHVERLERLRVHAAGLVARAGGPAVAVDPDGHVAAVSGMPAPDHVPLPADMAVGTVRLPTLGTAVAEPLPGGWLLRPVAGDPPEQLPTALELDLSGGLAGDAARLRVSGASGSWSQVLTPRHAEILVALLVHRGGRSAAELAQDLFADPSRTVTVRAEMSRLRRVLGPVLRRQPYRVADEVTATLVLPPDAGAVLPGSNAPVVTALRHRAR